MVSKKMYGVVSSIILLRKARYIQMVLSQVASFFLVFFRPVHFVSKELSEQLRKGLIQLETERASARFNG